MRKLRTVSQHILVSALVAALTVGPAAWSRADVVQKAGGNTPVGAVQAAGNGWNITAPNGAIIHYSSFDVAAGQVVTFMNQNAGGGDVRVLNRILGKASSIDGTITGSGGNFFLYFMNPAGIVFGPNSQVVGNIAGLEAVGGHLSDTDFKRGVDHFTGVHGRVSNAGQIAANAVALVGGQVANSGSVIAEGGWIVMAAGNDVLIGRDSANQGVLLRVEGAANAVFNQNATGVSNTGTLSAGAAANPASGNVSLGAGDLYGTAIFSNQAIEARKIALSADAKGDIALGGSVKASELDVTQVGEQTGQLKGTGGAAAPNTINADSVNLVATGTKGDVRVGAGLAFRDTADDGKGPTSVSVDQQHDLTTANLSGLDVGSHDGVAHDGVALSLSSSGTVTVTDKKLVDGTDLTLNGPTGVDLQGADALDVHTLNVSATNTISDGDITVRGKDIPSSDQNVPSTPAFSISGNLQFHTPEVKPTDPSPVVTLLSLGGTLGVKGDITTTNGGTLRLDGQNIELGSFDPITGAVGGNVDISGSVRPKLEIGFVDPAIAGTVIPNQVELTAINTQGAQHKPTDPPQPGGDVTIQATGNVLIHGAVTTSGQASGKKDVANEPGGRVDISSGDSITIGAVTTGGADAPAAGSTTPEAGAIVLSAPNGITLQGDLDTRGGSVGNSTGQRDRSIDLVGAGPVTLNADTLTVSGGDVTFGGQLVNGTKLDSSENTINRSVALTVNASGVTTLENGAGGDATKGGVPLQSIAINSKGGDVVFGGDVNAVTEVAVGFATSGVGSWRTTGSDVQVNANQVLVTSSAPNDEVATSASVSLDPKLHFRLDDLSDANDPNAAPTPGGFTLRQDAGLDAATLDSLFTPGRFASVVDETIDLESHATVAFDATAASAVQGANLIVVGNDFTTSSPLSVASLDLTALGALDANFSVTATNPTSSIIIQAGESGTGDLTADGSYHGDDITLIAGDDTGNVTTAKVVVTNAATFRDHAGNDAQRVTIRQDAAFATADLPDPSVFGSDFNSRTTPFVYQLESRDGTMTLSPGADAKVAGSALSLFGEQGIDLGTSVPLLASLAARTPVALDIENAIKTKSGGSIVLNSGLDGSGDLTINAELDSSKIDLFAGSNDGKNAKARVILDSGARFGSDADPTKSPEHFSLNQDAAIGGNAATGVPGTSFFAGGVLPAEFGLAANGGALNVNATQVDGTALSLTGKSIAVSGDLANLLSLDVTGPVSFDGNVTSAGHIMLNGNTTLTGASSTGIVPQTLSANGGDFDLTGTLTKTDVGDIKLTASGNLTTGSVTTAHLGSAVELDGAASVTAGKIDASGIGPSGAGANVGGKVTVQSNGAVVLTTVDTRGAAGLGESKGVPAGDGKAAGAIAITGQTITTGSLTATGGASGTTLATGSLRDSVGGAGGKIELKGPNGTPTSVSISGDVLADGGAGSHAGTASPAGASGNVTVAGPLFLLNDTSAGAAGNTIHGDVVEIDGAIGPGTPTGGTALLAANTGLVVRADHGLTLGGNVTAGSVDLELHDGPLALGPRTISADAIRLAASDGVGGNTTGVVDLGGLTFTGSNGTGPVASFTLDQDASIGGSGSPIPSLALFAGDGTALTKPFALALVAEDGDINLAAADLANVNGTALTLAAGAANVAGDSTVHIHVTGGDLVVPSLQLGTTTGAKGGSVGGNTEVAQSLSLGSSTGDLSLQVLTAIGNLTVDGTALFRGSAEFNGTVDQTVAVNGGALSLQGFNTDKGGAGKLELDARDGFVLSADNQTISSDHGALVLSNPLTKAVGALFISGESPDGVAPGVVVNGVNQNGLALQTLNGDLSVSATGSTGTGAGGIQLAGGASANGNLSLDGALVLQGGQPKYTFTAVQNAATAGTTTSGVLTAGGIASSDGDVLFSSTGPDPSLANQNPSAISLSGRFLVQSTTTDSHGNKTVVNHALELDGATEASADTTIEAGDVHFDSRIQGANSIDVSSHGVLQLDDDVAMTAGTFGARGDGGVQFNAASGQTQSITAGSIALGNGAAPPKSGTASLMRDGNLSLDATTGNVTVGFGQALVVNGALQAAATGTVTLGTTAAKSIALNSGHVVVYGGTTVQANSITTTASPTVAGGGSATFASPTGTEISTNVPSDQIVVRRLSQNGEPIQISMADFPLVAVPAVTGAAVFDYARLIPEPAAFHPLTLPQADRVALAAATENRPLWAEELIAYLEQRSLETPNQNRVEDAELLPPVGARPGELVDAKDARVRNTAVEDAVALYRGVFRRELRRDPDTGVVEAPDRSAELRSAFQAPVDALRHGDGQPVDGAALAELIDGDPRFAATRAERARLADLLDVGARALAPDQQPRFRALLLADIMPSGITPAEFDRAFR